ncbi:MAG: 3-dehydroquinate synthase [Gammaproteobacteria bacterium]|nr:3-dehydroquinate synthase [Gammaproteobacteria bacterium]MBT7522870.1 3-dehydroquinate synthase [Gammaproteobacteria bacterium]MDC3386033.1 3-dehydroquinate synthase [Gammaproteobacteria bacterium]|tara:strand:+ start:512 stop:1588 length:1077 start_codon:yes stop_codon:yes gene_type:complete
MKNIRKIIVKLEDRSYPIYIGKNILSDKSLLGKINVNNFALVTNKKIKSLHLSKIKNNSIKKNQIILSDGEKYKNQESISKIYSYLLKNKFSRDSCLVAFGGGVIGDMTGYASATYQRGINFIQIPTTLLSMVDSSVGGKTGINHPLGKNMIGAFHQPIAVIIDTEILKTLSKRQFNAGMAEVIKYGIIKDKNFFKWITKNCLNIKLQDPESIIKIIKRSCEIKAEIVSQDEEEKNIRALLNLGHTFGHAIENVLGYGKWLHGEAIACGFLIASSVAIQNKTMSINQYNDIKNLLEVFDLPTKLPKNINIENLFNAMLVDKKVKDNKMVYVLPNGIGDSYITNKISRKIVMKAFIQHA